MAILWQAPQKGVPVKGFSTCNLDVFLLQRVRSPELADFSDRQMIGLALHGNDELSIVYIGNFKDGSTAKHRLHRGLSVPRTN